MQKILRQTFLIAVLALLPAAASAFLNPKKPIWSEQALAKDEVFLATAQGWGEDVIWLDARPESKYKKEHIPGALLLNEDDWDGLLAKVLESYNPSKKVVVYCGSETCQPSHDVAKRLTEQVGWKDVYVLKGGWESWQQRPK